MSPEPMRVQLLGELALEIAGTSRPIPYARGPRALLAWLALHPGDHSRAQVAAALWPGYVETCARNSLRTALSALRRQLGPEASGHLTSSRERIALSRAVAVDVLELRELQRSGQLGRAIERHAGELLPWLDDEWAVAARERHHECVHDLLGQLVAEACDADDLPAAIRWARHRLALDPLSEDALRQLMRLLAATGARAEALALYGRLRERLRRELRIAPSPETRRLAGELRERDRDEPAPVWHPLPLPPRMQSARRGGFVGRADALERLAAGWERALGGSRSLILVSGEAGVGKSRLCAELAARLDGANVLYGACVETGGPCHGMFEALRPLADAAPALLLDRLGPRLGSLLPAAPARAAPARHHLFAALAELLTSACEAHPTVLVLEDLQWADAETLLALQHVMRALLGRRLLVIATFRGDALTRAPRLTATLVQLRREEAYARIRLHGLERADSERLIADRLGHEPPPELVRTLHERADGNPFFVEELLRDRTALPATLRTAIDQRVASLSGEAQHVMAAAARLGRRFDGGTLHAACELDDDTFDAALDEALAAELLTERDHGYAFRHMLVRDALYERERRRQHRRLHVRPPRHALGVTRRTAA